MSGLSSAGCHNSPVHEGQKVVQRSSMVKKLSKGRLPDAYEFFWIPFSHGDQVTRHPVRPYTTPRFLSDVRL